MNSGGVIGGVKKPALCRYFVASGTCFYGDDCQFLHTSPPPPPPPPQNVTTSTPSTSTTTSEPYLSQISQDLLETIVGSSTLDYLPYSHHNGLASESKLSTYICSSNAPGSLGRSTPKQLATSDKLYPFQGSSNSSSSDVDGQLSSGLSSLGIDMMAVKTPNPAASEFVPRSATPAKSASSHATSSSFSSSLFGFDGISFSSRLSQGLTSTSVTNSPLSSPHLTPQHSPSLKRGAASSPVSITNADPFGSSTVSTFQQNVDGTTYFYPPGEGPPSGNDNHVAVLPNYVMFPFTPAHVQHMKPKANAPSFFMPDELRLEILHLHSLTMAQVDPRHYPDIPLEVDNYHNLFPLEAYPSNPLEKSNTFGYTTSVFKATNIKTGLAYCLRKIHGFRTVYPMAMTVLDMWKKLQHSNVVQLREVFTTKSFGEHSIVFVHDYHPGAETLMAKHFSSSMAMNGLTTGVFRSDKSGGRLFAQSKADGGEPRQHAGLLPESLIWAYVVQLCSAIRTIHAAGLACHILDPTKILITSKSRLRLGCCAIYDVLAMDPNQSNPLALVQHYQQDDLVSLGKLVLALACNSLVGLHCENLANSMELVARNYSTDLRNLIVYLLSNHNRPRSVNDIMPMIGARFFTQLDAAHLRSDVIENELAKEVENGRLFRIVTKLGIINERPEFNLDPSWCETGDRYMLKLFRDYLFHQVSEDGRPWIDIAHIVQCLNKLDAGVSEKICLMSRDEQNVLVVTYSQLKDCFEASFSELEQAAVAPKVT